MNGTTDFQNIVSQVGGSVHSENPATFVSERDTLK